MQFSKNPLVSTFFWSILALQCWSVSAVQQGGSALRAHKSPSVLDFLPIQVTREHCLEFPVLHSRFSLVSYFKCRVAITYMSIPISHAPSPAPWQSCLCSLHLCLHFCSLLKKQSFPLSVCWIPLPKMSWPQMCGFIQGFVPWMYMSVLCQGPTALVTALWRTETRECYASRSILLSQDH